MLISDILKEKITETFGYVNRIVYLVVSRCINLCLISKYKGIFPFILSDNLLAVLFPVVRDMELFFFLQENVVNNVVQNSRIWHMASVFIRQLLLA